MFKIFEELTEQKKHVPKLKWFETCVFVPIITVPLTDASRQTMILGYCKPHRPISSTEADASRQLIRLAGAAVLHYCTTHTCCKSTDTARRSISDSRVGHRPNQSHWPRLRVDRCDWPMRLERATCVHWRMHTHTMLRTHAPKYIRVLRTAQLKIPIS